ncbi:MAG TPA: hypothetical protein PK084_06900, partial [Novosphingobium sp.]|nr:hypothetical protein [Novosphingobium sp.]HQD99159.1 hypothetical protein [Novosphingobium sp.]
MARTDPGSGAEPHSGWQRGLFAGGRAHFRICDSELKFMEMSRNAGPSKALGHDLPPSEWPNFCFRIGHEG